MVVMSEKGLDNNLANLYHMISVCMCSDATHLNLMEYEHQGLCWRQSSF